MPRLIGFWTVVMCWLALNVTPAFAAPKVTQSTEYYTVKGKTAAALRKEMARKGPKGFWGYARWSIRWSASCRVEVRVKYSLPKHANLDALSPEVRTKFSRMLINLEAHEKLHDQNGIDAAREIDRANCKSAQAIIRKYNKADIALDRRTKHGALDGVVLD